MHDANAFTAALYWLERAVLAGGVKFPLRT